jgi:hypothetical protein
MQPPIEILEPPVVHPRGLLLATAIGGALNRASGIGTLAAAGAGVVVALVVAPAVGWIAGLLLAGLAGALVGGIVTVALVPSRLRRAFESFAWLGHREMTRFRERSGGSVPTTPDAMAAWLAASPPSTALATARIELLAMLGRIGEARAELARLDAPSSALEEVERTGVEALVGFIETGDESDVRLREVSARLDPASPEGMEAAVAIAIGAARARLDRGDPGWAEPLLAVRPRLGREALATTIRDFWLRAAATFAAMAIAGALIVWTGQAVLGGLAGLVTRA